jgi:hypothetical protein
MASVAGEEEEGKNHVYSEKEDGRLESLKKRKSKD